MPPNAFQFENFLRVISGHLPRWISLSRHHPSGSSLGLPHPMNSSCCFGRASECQTKRLPFIFVTPITRIEWSHWLSMTVKKTGSFSMGFKDGSGCLQVKPCLGFFSTLITAHPPRSLAETVSDPILNFKKITMAIITLINLAFPIPKPTVFRTLLEWSIKPHTSATRFSPFGGGPYLF